LPRESAGARLARALLLGQRGNCAPYDLEGELWEPQLCRELVQHALAIVAGVHELTVFVRKDERFGRWIRTLLFPAPEISGQLPGNMNNPETLSGFAPRAELAHVGVFADAHGGFCEVEAYQGRDGTVWAGTLSGGVSALRNDRFTTYTMANGMSSNTITSIAESLTGQCGLPRRMV
jgi:hypothetical protein